MDNFSQVLFVEHATSVDDLWSMDDYSLGGSLGGSMLSEKVCPDSDDNLANDVVVGKQEWNYVHLKPYASPGVIWR